MLETQDSFQLVVKLTIRVCAHGLNGRPLPCASEYFVFHFAVCSEILSVLSYECETCFVTMEDHTLKRMLREIFGVKYGGSVASWSNCVMKTFTIRCPAHNYSAVDDWAF